MHILVKDKRTGAEDWIPIERAAVLMGMEADDIDAALGGVRGMRGRGLYRTRPGIGGSGDPSF